MKKGKFRVFSVLCAVMLCMAAFASTAFAADSSGCYESNEDGSNTPSEAITDITVNTEDVPMPSGDGSGTAIEWDVDAETIQDLLSLLGGTSLTPEGNLTLVDDIYQVESYASDESELKDKQFITVQTKTGNYFYLIIDRSGDTENVYFLNMVDEADLMALMEDGDSDTTVSCTCTDKCVAGDVNTSCPVCKNNMSECTGKEAAVEPDSTTEPDATGEDEPETEKSGSNTGILLVVLVVALAGGGALYWFKFRKPKADTKGSADLDDYDYGDDEDDDEDLEFEQDNETDASDDENKE